jgi:hypothetical protein
VTRRMPDPDLKSLDKEIEQIPSSAQTDDQAFRAWHHVFEDRVALPCDGFVIGEPIAVVEFGYDGNPRRGLAARCRRADETTHVVAACDVMLPPRSAGGSCLAAYRRGLGLEPFPSESPGDARAARQHKATASDVELTGPVELVLLSVKATAARCLLLGTRRAITLRATRLWDAVPGEVIVVTPRKQWSYAGHPYLSGEIQSARLDVPALDLVPLRLKDEGIWDPREQYWGEPDEPLDEWAKPIIARGKRREFEMEQVLPGAESDDPESDPITESNDLKDAGDVRAALRILMELCQVDLRCLDAHAHLGNLRFDHHPALAIRHYEVGLRIGELSLSEPFDGLLPWGFIDNRPFLRCLHGFGLCCWRLGRFGDAERVFQRMLWLNPSDNQGVRFLIDAVHARTSWEDRPEQT